MDRSREIVYPSLAPEAIEAGVRDVIAAAEVALARALAGAGGEVEPFLAMLDDVARIVAAGMGRYAHLRMVDPDEVRRGAAAEAAEELERWRQAAAGRPDLATAIDVAARRADGLDDEARALLGRWRAEVRLTGVGLPAGEQASLRADRERLLELSTAFVARLGDHPVIEIERARLTGLSDDVLAGLADGTTPGTAILELTDPVAMMVLERVHDRGVRELVGRTRLRRGGAENKAALIEAAQLRRRIARRLGARSWAALRLEQQMAGTPEAVESFLLDLVARLQPLMQQQLDAMRDLLVAQPGVPADGVVEDWDRLYLDRITREASGFDVDELRDYLAVEDVFEGMVQVIDEVLGVRLVRRLDGRAWHPDVRFYDLVDTATGSPFATVLVDPFARGGKTAGAWADVLDPGPRDHDPAHLPALVLVSDSTAPTSGDARLTPSDVETLFHEFGHIVQMALALRHGRYWNLNDGWTLMDWIEAPSQFLGRWGTDATILGRFARHRTTGAPVPAALIETFRRAERLNGAIQPLRMASLALFDLRLHGPEELDADALNRETWSLRGVPFVDGTFAPGSIAHLMASYDATTYGYLWAEVLSDDLLVPFAAAGMHAPAVGAAYRTEILELPILADPTSAVRRFLGREPSNDAYFARITGGSGTA